jgi:multiple antibiotic resistance protein
VQLPLAFEQLALAFVALFVALDIIGTLPMYVSITSGMERGEREKTLNTSLLVAFGVAVVFLFMGNAIFRALGITIADFRVAGGIVLLLVSLADLMGSPEHERRATGSTGIVPLAVPLISGPGVLTTTILQAGSFGYVITLVALLANFGIAWVTLHNSERVTRVIGKDGTVVVSKIAALLLAAIAIAMIRAGIFESVRAFQQGG